MKIKNIAIIVLVSLNLITSIWIIRIYHTQPTATLVWQDCVPDANSAITIAQVVYNSYFGEWFEKEYFECVEGEIQW